MPGTGRLSLRGASTDEDKERRKTLTEQVSKFDHMRDLATGRGTSD